MNAILFFIIVVLWFCLIYMSRCGMGGALLQQCSRTDAGGLAIRFAPQDTHGNEFHQFGQGVAKAVVEPRVLMNDRTTGQQGDESIFAFLEREMIGRCLHQPRHTAEFTAQVSITRCLAAPGTSIDECGMTLQANDGVVIVEQPGPGKAGEPKGGMGAFPCAAFAHKEIGASVPHDGRGMNRDAAVGQYGLRKGDAQQGVEGFACISVGQADVGLKIGERGIGPHFMDGSVFVFQMDAVFVLGLHQLHVAQIAVKKPHLHSVAHGCGPLGQHGEGKQQLRIIARRTTEAMEGGQERLCVQRSGKGDAETGYAIVKRMNHLVCPVNRVETMPTLSQGA